MVDCISAPFSRFINMSWSPTANPRRLSSLSLDSIVFRPLRILLNGEELRWRVWVFIFVSVAKIGIKKKLYFRLRIARLAYFAIVRLVQSDFLQGVTNGNKA